MPELPPQSPEPPVIALSAQGAAAPAAVMSWKSAYCAETVAAVIVTAVPKVADVQRYLFATLFPLTVNVPVTVWFAENLAPNPLEVPPVKVRLLNVFAVAMVMPPALPPVMTRLCHVDRPPPLKVAAENALVIVMVAVFAVSVMFVDVLQSHARLTVSPPAIEIAAAPRVSVRTVDPLAVNDPANETVLLFMSKVPAVSFSTELLPPV